MISALHRVGLRGKMRPTLAVWRHGRFQPGIVGKGIWQFTDDCLWADLASSGIEHPGANRTGYVYIV